jgi:hypothetical protein
MRMSSKADREMVPTTTTKGRGAMNKLLLSMASLLVLCMASACGDDGKDSCSDVGSYKCDSGVVYLCRFDSDSGDNYWEAKQDCTQSSTSGCTCTVVSGLGTCMANGSACQGEYLD